MMYNNLGTFCRYLEKATLVQKALNRLLTISNEQFKIARDALLHVEKGGCLLIEELPCSNGCFQRLMEANDGFNEALDDLAEAEQAERHLNITFITEQEIKANRTTRARRLTFMEISKFVNS